MQANADSALQEQAAEEAAAEHASRHLMTKAWGLWRQDRDEASAKAARARQLLLRLLHSHQASTRRIQA